MMKMKKAYEKGLGGEVGEWGALVWDPDTTGGNG